jgi:hypothetical protein
LSMSTSLALQMNKSSEVGNFQYSIPCESYPSGRVETPVRATARCPMILFLLRSVCLQEHQSSIGDEEGDRSIVIYSDKQVRMAYLLRLMRAWNICNAHSWCAMIGPWTAAQSAFW